MSKLVELLRAAGAPGLTVPTVWRWLNARKTRGAKKVLRLPVPRADALFALERVTGIPAPSWTAGGTMDSVSVPLPSRKGIVRARGKRAGGAVGA